jgi:Leucine-rich repeat (LRR) protein
LRTIFWITNVIANLFAFNTQILDLQGNDITIDLRSIPAENKLSGLRLSGTRLQSLEGIHRASHLESLHASDNTMGGPFPPGLLALTGLRQLYLSFNIFEGPIPAAIGDLSNLEELYLYDNKFNHTIPTEIGKLRGLRELVLGSNVLTGIVPSEINSLASLQEFSVQDQKGETKLSGSLPTFEAAAGLRYVRALVLTGVS